VAGRTVPIRGLLDDRASGMVVGSFAGHNFVVVHWIVFHGQLEKAVNDEASAPRSSVVEPEYKVVQVRLFDLPLVSAEKPPFRQRGDPMYPWQQPMWVTARHVVGTAPGDTRDDYRSLCSPARPSFLVRCARARRGTRQQGDKRRLEVGRGDSDSKRGGEPDWSVQTGLLIGKLKMHPEMGVTHVLTS